MELFAPAHLHIELDDYDNPADVVDALALRPFAAGEHPWSRAMTLQGVRPGATLLPPDVEPELMAIDTDRTVVLAFGPGWALRVSRARDATARLVVTAIDAATGAPVLEAATKDATEPVTEDDDTTPIGFWTYGAHGPHRRQRRIAIEPWADIRRNYTARAAESFDRLMDLDATDATGRLLLLHGPPGTGKTTALRALAFAWRTWCTFDAVLDPERFFGDPNYLLSVVLGHDDDDSGPKKWRLLLLEDCDELIRAEAKAGTGQSLSRLLNLTDGLLGQGLEIIVAITTNEPMTRLHPAITRPGRCLAEIEAGPLTPDEARRWLGTAARIGPNGATLAELYTRRGRLRVIEEPKAAASTGQYL